MLNIQLPKTDLITNSIVNKNEKDSILVRNKVRGILKKIYELTDGNDFPNIYYEINNQPEDTKRELYRILLMDEESKTSYRLELVSESFNLYFKRGGSYLRDMKLGKNYFQDDSQDIIVKNNFLDYIISQSKRNDIILNFEKGDRGTNLTTRANLLYQEFKRFILLEDYLKENSFSLIREKNKDIFPQLDIGIGSFAYYDDFLEDSLLCIYKYRVTKLGIYYLDDILRKGAEETFLQDLATYWKENRGILIDKADIREDNIERAEINTLTRILNTPSISNHDSENNEKVIQEFYEIFKTKDWEKIFNFLLYNQDEPILKKYFSEINPARDRDQINLTTKNNRYHIKIQDKMLIMEKRNRKRTINIGENGFNDIWNKILEDMRLTYHKFVIDKEYAIDHLKSLIEKKEIHDVFKNREQILKVFPDKLFGYGTRQKGTKSKVRIKINQFCAFGIYTDSTFGKAYRMTVQSRLGMVQNQIYFEKNGDCFVSRGNRLHPINEKEWSNFMTQISAIFTELKNDLI